MLLASPAAMTKMMGLLRVLTDTSASLCHDRTFTLHIAIQKHRLGHLGTSIDAKVPLIAVHSIDLHNETP
jgi:hypothetical protein